MTRRLIGFQDSVAGLPQLFWKVEIFAVCPQCGSEATLGGLQGGGTVVACTACQYRSLHKDSDSDAVARAVLQRATTPQG